MNIIYDGQLITASIIITFRGKTIKVDNVIIDTGSSHTVISPDVLEEIGIIYENGDTVYEAYGIGGTVSFYTKTIDCIEIDGFYVNNFELDVSVLPKDQTGLLGLDVLINNRFIVDLDKLELFIPKF